MSELFDKSIRTLELPRVLQLLSEQAVSPEAKELALAVRPETDYEDVLRLLDQTDGARAMIVLRGAPGFSGVKPVKDLLDRADRGGSLNIPELIRIGDLLYAARRAKEYFNADAAEPTALDQIFLSIHGNRFLEDKIRRCISDENTVADAASPELADIRRHMRAALAKSRQILQKIISSPSYSKVLQDNIITRPHRKHRGRGRRPQTPPAPPGERRAPAVRRHRTSRKIPASSWCRRRNLQRPMRIRDWTL